jgi:nucleoside-diphosphate-sugar epimerase
MTRSPEKLADLRKAGADGVVADALDAEALMAAVLEKRPDVVVHQLTALSSLGTNARRFDRDFAMTNRLRSEGTDHLLTAARAAGARRFVAQSFAGWPYARQGGPVKTEEDPLDPTPPRSVRRTIAAIRHLEEAVLGAPGMEGLVLRYGGFYGPGTSLARQGGPAIAAVRQRRFPLVGDGGGVWSFVHIDDAAEATAAAVDRGAPGIYNVVDDEPAPVSAWLPALATALGARPPLRVPVWLGPLAGGELAVSLMTQVRGAANAKAKRELGWSPRHGSWRQGFLEVMAS